MTTRAWLLALPLAAAVLTGCSPPGPDRAPGVEPAPQLAAALVSPIDIELRWSINDPAAVGRIVEFATEPRGPYTILGFLPPGRATYRHSDLMPQTPFYYRVRSVYGPSSDPVEVALPPGEFDEKSRQDDHRWAEPRTVGRRSVETRPIRRPGAATSDGAPTAFQANVMHANGIRFTWVDHASDEEGYLLEVRQPGRDAYAAAAVLDADVNSFGLITLPDEKKAAYRVRAFYYGAPSNLAHQKTGREPSPSDRP
jgi:hypothetical protein